MYWKAQEFNLYDLNQIEEQQLESTKMLDRLIIDHSSLGLRGQIWF